MTVKADSDNRNLSLGRYQKMRRLWLFVGIVLVGALLMLSGPRWAAEDVTENIELVGVGLIWIGVLGRLWSILYIGGHKSSTVIMDGPYSMMRNPLYFFSTIAAVGVGFQSATLTAGFIFGLLCWLAFEIVIRREEKHLLSIFGAPYSAYCASVPRFFPNARLFKDEPTLLISTRRMYSTLLDGLVFFVALPAFEFAEYLQDIGLIPVLFRLY